jgi:dihydroorotate dehydrogenase electron transfer subunit
LTREHRGTIFLEDGDVLSHLSFPGDQHLLRIAAPQCAVRAAPGQFVHLRCDADIPMRRPLSIQRADSQAGWIEVLYKPVGPGLAALTRVSEGDRLSLLGPIGQGFQPDSTRPRCVLIGGGVGIPPLLFLAERLATSDFAPVSFFGSELPFPFTTGQSDIQLQTPASATHSLALLEEWGVPGRLASNGKLPGCYPGYVTELAREWLKSLNYDERDACAIYSCGPDPMLRAAQQLARDFDLPSQLCLEEYMACAVGGCAGCAIEVHTDDGPAMRRVCVDGPVFDGYTVYPATPG